MQLCQVEGLLPENPSKTLPTFLGDQPVTRRKAGMGPAVIRIELDRAIEELNGRNRVLRCVPAITLPALQESVVGFCNLGLGRCGFRGLGAYDADWQG